VARVDEQPSEGSVVAVDGLLPREDVHEGTCSHQLVPFVNPTPSHIGNGTVLARPGPFPVRRNQPQLWPARTFAAGDVPRVRMCDGRTQLVPAWLILTWWRSSGRARSIDRVAVDLVAAQGERRSSRALGLRVSSRARRSVAAAPVHLPDMFVDYHLVEERQRCGPHIRRGASYEAVRRQLFSPASG
jgi:hypothetical protein